jgi:hypothetical protein
VVRGASVQALAQWDKSGRVAEPSIYQALSDPQPEVQRAALLALMYNNQLNSERLKSALMNIISSPGAPDGKMIAMQGLERFSLNSAEFAVYDQARSQLPR